MIKDANIFISLNLANGYTQIPLVESACAKTAFITPDDTGVFTTAMFGLINASFHFSKLMSILFRHLKFLIKYFDDLFIAEKI